MANRSDRNSTFPRQLKRLWTMTKFENAHEAGEWKRDFIAAHDHAKKISNNLKRIDFSDEKETKEEVKA
jgi:hypothetical protein